MKFLTILFALTLATIAHATPDNGWPRLTENHEPALCSQTLALARAANATSTTRLDLAAAILGPGPNSGFLLYPASPQSADAPMAMAPKGMVSDSTTIDNSLNLTFYATVQNGGWQHIVMQRPFNWRGDWYSLYLADANNPIGALRSAIGLMSEYEDIDNLTSPNFKTLVTGNSGWVAPWLWQATASSTLAILPYPNDWQVFGTNPEKPLACRIAFHPPVTNARQLLPGPVAKLAATLDKILGEDGPDAGTLRPINSIRFDLNTYDWPNLVFRPSAQPEPYNSWKEIDAGLATWSRGDAENTALMRAMYKQYPAAEQALARHYAKYFGMDEQEALAIARRNLDLITRDHFTFPSTQ